MPDQFLSNECNISTFIFMELSILYYQTRTWFLPSSKKSKQRSKDLQSSLGRRATKVKVHLMQCKRLKALYSTTESSLIWILYSIIPPNLCHTCPIMQNHLPRPTSWPEAWILSSCNILFIVSVFFSFSFCSISMAIHSCQLMFLYAT